MSSDVWSLEVFRRAYALSLEVHRASLGFAKTEQYGGVADQLRRSSKSVCALLAEGSGRQRSSDAEFRRYLVMALGSAEEAKLWCCYVRDLGFVDADVAQVWIDRWAEIARMLAGLTKRLSTKSPPEAESF